MNTTQLNLIASRLPRTLNLVPVNVARILQQMTMPEPPRLLMGTTVDGVTIHGKADQRKFVYYPATQYDDRYVGNIKRDTLTFYLEGYDLNTLRDMMHDLKMTLESRELDLVWALNGMQLSKVFNPMEFPETRDPRTGIPLYRIAIDVWIDYEFVWMDLTPPIQSFNYLIQSDGHIGFDATYYAPGSYGMSIKLIVQGD